MMNSGLVLLYHRIIELDHDPHQLAVSRERFSQQIGYLKEKHSVISLQEMLKRMKDGKSLKNCIVITFDDGYADNFYNAKSILEKNKVPAAFFITVNMIDSKKEFWWDQLENIVFFQGKKNPSDIKIGKMELSFPLEDIGKRKEAYRNIHKILRNMPYTERQKAMKILEHNSGLEDQKSRRTHLPLKIRELQELAQEELFEIGSHTLNHNCLSLEDEDVQWKEINDSRMILQQMTGQIIGSISFPFGCRRDFNKISIHLAKKAGYSCTITNIQGSVSSKTDPFHIPRRLIRNWDMEHFEHNINSFFKSPA